MQNLAALPSAPIRPHRAWSLPASDRKGQSPRCDDPGGDAQHGTTLVAAFYAFTDPAGLFPKKHASLQDLPDGATIAVHVDPSNHWCRS
ncbi:hypothetical protein HOY34_06605 [Xinfangfangia sp. D13-10-4-6]|uniref:MetQ/NlpA family ABC transporter substrate-binding protein n=1 Tax=Pseudogemmobacter hezensis TaxID=2737662 RepID=UPI0015543A13|nr:MetQ/NlpA family ABC transporter substrate-binding protein [Pseudogemmobacter hezensis]NPD14877.1 hypothetical protein [Pseudogemmobacter hezensis]